MVEAAAIPEDFARPVVRSTPDERINAIRAQVQGRGFLEQIVEQFELFGYGRRKDFVMENAVAALRGNIQADPSLGNVFILSYTATDPQFAREVTSRLAQRLIQFTLMARKDKAEKTDLFVQGQLRQTESELAAQEEKIKQFKTEHLGELPEQSSLNINALSTLNSQLRVADDAIQEVQDRKKALSFRQQELKRLDVLSRSLFTPPSNPVSEPQGSDTVATNPELASRRARLAELQARLTPKHPDVVQLASQIAELEKQLMAGKPPDGRGRGDAELTPLGQSNRSGAGSTATGAAGILAYEVQDAEIRNEIEAADNEIVRRQKDRDEIARQIKAYKQKLSLAPALEQELAALTLNSERLRQQYRELQARKFNASTTTKLEEDTSKDTYSIIDEASLPSRPAFPSRLHIVLLGIGGGILLGLGAAVGREYLDPTLRDEGEAARILTLPVLASIPELREKEIPVRRRIKAAAN
jgi:uncharacterized protein involved in exopolysaccharide biosynthesis